MSVRKAAENGADRCGRAADAVVGFILFGMGLCMLAALAAAGVRLAGRLAAGGGWVAAGMALYLAVAAVCAWGMRMSARRLSPGRHAAAVIGIYGAVLLAQVAGIGGRIAWRGDATLLCRQVEAVAGGGYAPEVLSAMSDSYDYRVWARRAEPWYNLIRRVSGADGFRTGVQLFHAAVMLLAAWLTWRLGMSLFGARAAAIALAFHVLMPWRIFTHLDLAHHIVGSCYFTAGAWILVEWHRCGRRRAEKAGLAAAAAALLPLMRLEGGIDSVFLGAAAATLALVALARRATVRETAFGAVALLAVPLLAGELLVGPLDRRIEASDLHHYDSGIPAWTLRGWCLESGGQYYGDYEQVDCLTPVELKKKMVFRILASQAFYNPGDVAFSLLPVKAAKYFMAGFASSFEELLLAPGRRPALYLHIGARNAFLFCLLPCAACGVFLLLASGRRRELIPFAVPFAVLAGAYVVFGEADARYSAYIHSFLFLAAAVFLARRQAVRDGKAERKAAAGERDGRGALLRALPVPAAMWLVLSAAWVGGIHAVRPFLADCAVWDMRKATISGGEAVPRSRTLAPFEIKFARSDAGASWGAIALPVPEMEACRFTFYLLPQDVGLGASRGTEILLKRPSATGEGLEEDVRLPARVALAFAAGEPKRFELAAKGEHAPFALSIGYATLEGASPAGAGSRAD